MTDIALTAHERRILTYLDQRGTTERRKMLLELATENSMVASRALSSRAGQPYYNGSNGAAPMIVANWTRRLVAAGFVTEVRSDDRWSNHIGYKVTRAGRDFMRLPHEAT